MGLIIRICMTGIVVFLLAQILPGVSVADYFTAILVAVILALLNFIVKPVLVLLTLPITVLTLGLFLLVINAVIILLTDALMDGFAVSGFWIALLNLIVKPVLVLLTLPITVVTLGLFLLVINAIIILFTDALIGGFEVSGFWIALLFSLLLSLFQSILFSFLDKD